jgi:hypothetical protein
VNVVPNAVLRGGVWEYLELKENNYVKVKKIFNHNYWGVSL